MSETRRSSNNEVAQYLRRWLEANQFDSTYQDDGYSSRCRGEYAAAMRPAAEGMIALAEKGAVRVVRSSEDMPHFPRSSELNSQPSWIAVFTNQWPKEMRKAPDKSRVFGPSGDLRLLAVTLEMGSTYDGTPGTELGIVVRALRNGLNDTFAGSLRQGRKDLMIGGHTVMTIQPDGRYNYSRYELYIQDSSPQLFEYTMGLQENKANPYISGFGGGEFDNIIGFPGAEDYLAKHLPSLGSYLASLAEQL